MSSSSSNSNQSSPRKRVGPRIIRALFAGLVIGFIGGLAIYILAVSVNLQANTTLFNPVAFLGITLGASIAAMVSVEVSEYLDDEG